MNRNVKRIAVFSYVGLVATLGGATVLAEHYVDARTSTRAWDAALAGDPAPSFTLRSLDDTEVTLAALRGEGGDKVVVLEWFDPQCEWVRGYHLSPTLRDMQAEFEAAGVSWAAVYSSTPPAGDDPAEINKAAAERWGIRYPVLLDLDRSVAGLYEVDRAPTVVVISAAGEIIYRGVIDDAEAPGEPGTHPHLRRAIEAALGGETPEAGEVAGPGCHLQDDAAIDRH